MGVKESDSLRLQLLREICRELQTGSRCSAWRSEASRKQIRLDSIPPNGNSGINSSKKMELPPTKKDDLKAPGKKTGTAAKREKPKHMPPKVKGAELWHDCPAEFLSAAKKGLVSGRIVLHSPDPGLLIKEIKPGGCIGRTKVAARSKKMDSSPSSTSLRFSRDKSLGTSKKLSNTRSKQKRTFPKPKGKSR